MIDWIKRTKPPSVKATENRHRPFYLIKVHLNQVPTSMNDLALLFIAGSVILDSSMMVSLFAKSDAVQRTIMEHLAPHYKEVKMVYVEDEVEIINMQYVKTESFQLFNQSDSDFIEIINDLYRTRDMTNWRFEGKRKISHYAVIKEKLNQDNLSNTHAVKSFITDAYIKINKPLIMVPTGWKLDDHLKESISLRFFASFIPKITLLVDDNNEQVVAIELCSMDGS